MMEENQLHLLQWYIGLIIAVMLILSGVRDFTTYNKFEKKAVEVQAVVSQVASRLDSNGAGKTGTKKVYIPYVDYEYNGMVYRKVRLNARDLTVQVGETVTMLVNPDNPSQVMEENTGRNLFYMKVLGGLTLVVIMLVKIKETKSKY